MIGLTLDVAVRVGHELGQGLGVLEQHQSLPAVAERGGVSDPTARLEVWA